MKTETRIRKRETKISDLRSSMEWSNLRYGRNSPDSRRLRSELRSLGVSSGLYVSRESKIKNLLDALDWSNHIYGCRSNISRRFRIELRSLGHWGGLYKLNRFKKRRQKQR
jgi:hypothetical protein